MSDILNYIEENHKETQRLIGVEYEQLQHLLQKFGEANIRPLAKKICVILKSLLKFRSNFELLG